MASNPNPLLQLDPTPTFEEEIRDFAVEARYEGRELFDPESAKSRIDKIARRLAVVWSAFLIYIIIAQGISGGWRVRLQLWKAWDLYLIPKFHLESADFIAVVTTTTAAVFGFLVIVTNHLFFKRVKADP